jgi:RNA polymerase sigma-70 factor (ECF subfamily)
MDFHSDPDVILMLRVRDGDGAAFDALIDKYRKPLLNVIARTIGRDADAEDLAQDVFVRVYRAAPRYEPNAKFSTGCTPSPQSVPESRESTVVPAMVQLVGRT